MKKNIYFNVYDKAVKLKYIYEFIYNVKCSA